MSIRDAMTVHRRPHSTLGGPPGPWAPRTSLRALLAAALLAVLLAAAAPAATAQEPPPGAEPSAPAAAAEPPAEQGPEVEEPPYEYLDALTRDTPRGAMRGFLESARGGEWEEAVRYLDLSRLPEGERDEAGPELARQLKRVLDRQVWVELDSLADVPAGEAGDGLPPGRDRIARLTTAGGEPVDVLLRRMEEEGDPVWKVAGSTLARIPDLYAETGYGMLETWLPAVFFDWTLFEVQLWQWIGLAAVLLLAWLLSWLLARVVVRIARPLARRSATTMDDRLLDGGAPPLRFLIFLGLLSLGVLALRLAIAAEAFLLDLVQALVVLAVIWLTFRLVDIFSQWSHERLAARGRIAATSMLPLARKTLKVFLAALGLLAVLQNLGVQVTALIAGLGVGGLALALAAQKTIENLFGGMTLVTDQPVRVGDFCRFGDRVGTVEQVGLRSTRVRTLDRTVVTVPNAEFSQMQLENFALRDKIRLIVQLGLRYETTPDQLRWVLIELRRVLHAHPKVLPDPLRVRFVGFGAYSLDLEAFAYVDTQDFNEFLAVREDVFLRFMDVVADSGTSFAFPSQTTYLERGEKLPEDKLAAAEAQVRAWREANDLALPDFAAERLAEFDDSLDWPPAGSAVRPAEEGAAG